MSKIKQQILDLERQIMYIEFQDHISSEDYDRIAQYQKQIAELKKQLPTEGVYVRFLPYGTWFTGDPILSHAGNKNEAWLFDNEEEALEAIKKMYEYSPDLRFEFIKYRA